MHLGITYREHDGAIGVSTLSVTPLPIQLPPPVSAAVRLERAQLYWNLQSQFFPLSPLWSSSYKKLHDIGCVVLTEMAIIPSSPSQLPWPSLDRTFGAVLLGTFASRYFQMYSDDGISYKAVTLCTVLLETIHIAFSFHVCYHHLVVGYASAATLSEATWSIKLLPLLAGSIIAVSQGFFAYRAYKFGGRYKKWVLLALAFLLGELAFCVATITIEFGFTNNRYTEFVPYTWIISVASGLATAADITLAAVLIISLHASRSGMKKSDSVVDVLILYTVATGFITSIVMLALTITSLVIPQDLVFTGVSIVATKLYANALLAAYVVFGSALALREQLASQTISPCDVFMEWVVNEDSQCEPPTIAHEKTELSMQPGQNGPPSASYATDDGVLRPTSSNNRTGIPCWRGSDLPLR
ncbi:hypothetical protein C8Q80DRAFT_1274971 [Daedaleopsis nitida]|nr:hypothetical protein C8Q80DRAFT_1274971 [Daedaleopsis nitida]